MDSSLAPSSENPIEYKSRLKKILENSDTADTICDHVSNGGTIITLAEVWNVKANDIFNFMNQDTIRRKRYTDSLSARAEWERETILNQIRQIGTANLAAVFDDDGKMKPVSEWPDAVKNSLIGIEVDEIEEGIGNERIVIGQTKKIKTESKLAALKLLGTEIGMFRNNVVVSGRMTIDNLVEESLKQAIDVTPEIKKEETL